MRYKEIKNKTPYEILEVLEMREAPFNPFIIAEKLGIEVKTTLDFEKLHTEGQISVNEEGEPIVWVNPIKSEVRQRFTLAHELGHLANDILPSMESPIIDSYETLYRSTTFGGKETKANQFAARLLMPLKQIEDFIRECRTKIPDLNARQAIELISAKFEVSKQAAFHRLRNIGLVDQNYKYPF